MILTYTVLHVAPVGFEPPCVLGLIQLVENGKTNGSDRDQNLPKLVCIGDVPEDWVQVERKVRVKKIDERYHFEPV